MSSRLAALLALFVLARAAGGEIRVDEGALRIAFEADRSLVRLPVENTGAALSAILQVDALLPDDHVVSSAERRVEVPAGRAVLTIELPPALGHPRETEASDLLVDRLRYELRGEGGVLAHGLRSAGNACEDCFQLQVSAFGSSTRVGAVELAVEAHDRRRHQPVPGVEVTATWDQDDDQAPAGRTGPDGAATLRLVPHSVRGLPAVRVKGRRGALLETVSVQTWVGGDIRAIVTTDRPLYRPGQSLRVRVLALAAGRVLAGQALDVRVVDPGGVLLDRRGLVTSPHGIAWFEWPIPERAELGDHRIELRIPGLNESEGELARVRFRVARYELPVFRLEARSRRGFHLPGQDAEIEVQATALTGEPLPGAAVRVVRDRDEAVATATTDAFGRAVTTIGLDEEHRDLALRESLFEDEDFDVHVTDPVSRRTESRRVEVRMTRDPVHVYWQARGWQTPRGLPLEGWVSTYSADGTPVAAEVRLSGAAEAHVRTDRHGLARVSAGLLQGNELQDLRIEARDRSGRTGHLVERIHLQDGPAVSVTAVRTLLHPGAPARLLVRAYPAGTVDLRLWQDGTTLASRRVEAGPEGSLVELPTGGCGALAAVVSRPASSPWPVYSHANLLCPDGRGLSARLTPRPARGRPGSEIEASLALADARGGPLPGVAGLVGVDTALLDRARSEAEFGAPSWDPDGWPSDPERSGVHRSDLERLDSRRDWSDLQVVAEALLASEGLGLSTDSSPGEDEHVYDSHLRARVQDLKARLAPLAWGTKSPDSLAASLEFARQEGQDLTRELIEDPWGNPLVWRLVTERARRVLEAESSGPDEAPGTDDDLTIELVAWPWFAWAGPLLERALGLHLDRTHRLARTIDELTGEMQAEGLDPAAQSDPWGHPLGFTIRHQGRTAQLAAWSLGEPDRWPFDAFVAEVPMFAEEEALVRRAVSASEARLGRLPRDEAELGLAVRELLDPWGHPCTLRFSEQARRADRQVTTDSGRLRIVPVTEHTEVLEVMGPGPDGAAATTDDVVLASFRRVLSQDEGEASERPAPARLLEPVVTLEAGAVSGIVTDQQGAAIPGATVSLRCGEISRPVVTNVDGAYAFSSLVPGLCSLRVELTGFRAVTVPDVAVVAGQRVRVDVRMRVGGIQDVVEVVGSAPIVETSASLAGRVEASPARPTFTPRLREYFPETLVWQPEVIVDAKGQASIRFPLADSLTTWKLRAIASTDDGRVAMAEADVVGALPLSVELDPPPVLTVGDRIDLPVPVRNLLEKPQRVQLGLESEPALRVPADTRSIDLPRGGVVAPGFALEARTPARRAALTASAVGTEEGDRVRKPIEVRADGEPLVETLAEVTRGDAGLDFVVVADALPGSTWAELRVLPDLRAHVAAAVEGALQRPWGCAEQLTSSAFPSLLLLEMGGAAPELAARARRHLQRAVDGLARYEHPQGGFAYWAGAPIDAAVSVHVLRFLARAAKQLDVDDARLDRARTALLAAQREDGAWTSAWSAGEGSRALLTAQVARALAESSPDPREASLQAALQRARSYLVPQAARIDEPYLIATMALLAEQMQKPAEARALVARLRGLERRERDGGYWELQTNTPFHGWGAAGRVEATGLVLQALARLGEQDDAARADRALRFLLRRQDSYGVWWTSQATVNVLEGLVAHLATLPSATAAVQGPVEVWLDGSLSRQLTWPAAGTVSGPLILDLGPGLAPGSHRLELRGAPHGPASLQLVLGHARPWSEPERTPALRYSIAYDRRDVRVGEAVTVQVSAERAGFQGHGMLLAEVGLPPGADVDRASLEAALHHSGLCDYEVQPDRVVLYLWPEAGDSRLSFRFRPRYALMAQTAPSELYDYYNPEESTRFRPASFVVR